MAFISASDSCLALVIVGPGHPCGLPSFPAGHLALHWFFAPEKCGDRRNAPQLSTSLSLSLTTRPGNRTSRARAQFVRCHIRPVQDFAKPIAGGVVQIGMEILILHLARCDHTKILNVLYLHRACDKKPKAGP